jgi:hypothetical protein
MQREAQSADPEVSEVSMLLRVWSDGDQNALERMTPSFIKNCTA